MQRFDALLRDLLAATPSTTTLGLAVSGGSDSLALALLAHRWAKQHGIRLLAFTVDHGLRPESASEATQVAQWLAPYGIAHTTLRWEYSSPLRGNLQALAREARYALLVEACHARNITHCLLGHTADDQAETIALRHARLSGPVGLSGMSARKQQDDVLFLRPLLTHRRAELRAFLSAQQQPWMEDPSNESLDFARIRLRRGMEQQPDLVAHWLRLGALEAPKRQALEQDYHTLAAHFHLHPLGFLELPISAYDELPPESRLYALSQMLTSLSGRLTAPRYTELQRLDATGSGTLHGCILRRTPSRLRIVREPANVTVPTTHRRNRWDGRFLIQNSALDDFSPLGPKGLSSLRRLGVQIPHIPATVLHTIPVQRGVEDRVDLPHMYPHTHPAIGMFPAVFSPAKPLVELPFYSVQQPL